MACLPAEKVRVMVVATAQGGEEGSESWANVERGIARQEGPNRALRAGYDPADG